DLPQQPVRLLWQQEARRCGSVGDAASKGRVGAVRVVALDGLQRTAPVDHPQFVAIAVEPGLALGAAKVDQFPGTSPDVLGHAPSSTTVPVRALAKSPHR